MLQGSLRMVLAALVVAGCDVHLPPPVPTPYPPEHIPTVVALTGQAAFATALALTPSPAPSPAPAEVTVAAIPAQPVVAAASPTPSPEAGFDQYAHIHFISPGPMSKVVSPIQVQVLLVSGQSELVKVELLGEDGRVLARQVERVSQNPLGVYRSWKIPFEIRAAAEKGWLQISSDDESGYLQTLNTVPLLLLSIGANEINPPGNMVYERVALDLPREGERDSDGVLEVIGRIWPMNTQPVFVEVILPGGRIAGTRVLEPAGIDAQAFTTTVPYKLPSDNGASGLVAARLSFRQMDPILDIPLYIYSREVELGP